MSNNPNDDNAHNVSNLLTNFDKNQLARFEDKHGISFNDIPNESVYLNLRHSHFQPHNLTMAEWKGLRDLSQDKSFWVLPTDNNLGFISNTHLSKK